MILLHDESPLRSRSDLALFLLPHLILDTCVSHCNSIEGGSGGAGRAFDEMLTEIYAVLRGKSLVIGTRSEYSRHMR